MINPVAHFAGHALQHEIDRLRHRKAALERERRRRNALADDALNRLQDHVTAKLAIADEIDRIEAELAELTGEP